MSTRTFTEEEVQDLTDRVFLLKEHLEAGKMHFATKELSDGFFQSYEAIQLRPDGKVEPTSVDGRIRASTLALMAMRQREAVKNELSLAQIQQIYFDFLFREFGWLYEMMKKAGASPSESAEVLLRNDDMWQRLSKVLPEMVDVVREFWKGTGEAAGYHLQDGQQLKAVFAGDVFPAHWENAVSTAGLYVDTIILPCPLTRLGALLKASASRKIVTVVVKHILTAMTYKDIALADVDPPIAMIVPNRDDPSDDERSSLVLRAVPAICAHAKYLFGRTFDGVDDLQEFCLHLKTVDQVMKELKGPDRLIFDTEWGSSPSQQLSRAMIEHAYLPGMAEEPHAGLQIFNTSLGRMPQALGAQEASLHFRGTPYINAETSWLHFTWLLEYQGCQRAIASLIAKACMWYEP